MLKYNHLIQFKVPRSIYFVDEIPENIKRKTQEIFGYTEVFREPSKNIITDTDILVLCALVLVPGNYKCKEIEMSALYLFQNITHNTNELRLSHQHS